MQDQNNNDTVNSTRPENGSDDVRIVAKPARKKEDLTDGSTISFDELIASIKSGAYQDEVASSHKQVRSSGREDSRDEVRDKVRGEVRDVVRSFRDDSSDRDTYRSERDEADRPRRRRSTGNVLNDALFQVKNWITDHANIVLPVLLAIIAMLIAVIALRGNKKTEEKAAAEAAAAAASTVDASTDTIPLEKNAHEDVNALMQQYFTAVAAGDSATIESISSTLDEKEKISIQQMGNYIDSYPLVDVYTKPGPVDGSYVCFAVTEVRFTDYDKLIPGMQTMYVCTREDGSLYINEDETSAEVLDYIRKISLQSDVVDLNNKVTADYNDLLAADPDLGTFLDGLQSKINVAIGEALAAQEDASASASGTETAETASSGDSVANPADANAAGGESTNVEAGDGTETTGDAGGNGGTDTTTTTTSTSAEATEAVSVRKEASENADRITTIYQGEKVTVIEKQSNGWTKVTYKGQTGYIKTDYLKFD